MPKDFDLPWALLRKLRGMLGSDDEELESVIVQALESLDHLENKYIKLGREKTRLRAACEAALDLLVRCDAETRPNDLSAATDEDWDAVAIQLETVLQWQD